MQRGRTEDGVRSYAEWAGHGLPRRRIGERQAASFPPDIVKRLQRLVQFLDLGFEGGRAVDWNKRAAHIPLALSEIAVDGPCCLAQRLSDGIGIFVCHVVGVGYTPQLVLFDLPYA